MILQGIALQMAEANHQTLSNLCPRCIVAEGSNFQDDAKYIESKTAIV